MAAAKACGADWVRVFNLGEWGIISNSGYVDAIGPRLLQVPQGSWRRACDDIRGFPGEAWKPCSYGRPYPLGKAHDVEMSMADAAVITGSATGTAPDVQSILAVKERLSIPLLIGSGLNEANVKELWPYVDGAVIGSGFKKGADLKQPVDRELVNPVYGDGSSARLRKKNEYEENIGNDCG